MRIPEVSFFGLRCQVLYIKQYVGIVTMQKLAPGHLFPAIKVGVLRENFTNVVFQKIIFPSGFAVLDQQTRLIAPMTWWRPG